MNQHPWDLPRHIGRYEILSLLGRGGYAKVYKARLSGPMGFSKTVAIKVTAAPAAENSKQVKALVNEARVCGRLQHPNIIEVYEFGRWERQYFIAMEYIQGIPLDELIQAVYASGDRLSPGFAIDLLSQTCRGLHYAHQLVDDDGVRKTVIHRDLKPANLMLTGANMVKIMDFGIAKSALQLTKTMEGFTKGTPMYMSPEQVSGDALSPASDIYTLGIVLYELLTGSRLFAADNLVQVIEKVSRSDVADDLQRHAEAIGPLMPLLSRALARGPEERFTSAQELLAALEEIRIQIPAGRSIAAVVDRYREPEPPPRPNLGATPAGGPDVSLANAWSVVMPALGPGGVSEEDAATVSLELADDLLEDDEG